MIILQELNFKLFMNWIVEYNIQVWHYEYFSSKQMNHLVFANLQDLHVYINVA